MGLLFLGFVFLPWTQNIPAVGRVTSLTPNVRPQTIHAMIPGRIARWYTEEGKLVRAGDTILVISEIKDYYLDPELPRRLQDQITAKEGALQAQNQKIDALRRQIRALEEAREAALARAQNALLQAELRYKADSAALKAAEIDYTVALSQYQRQESLYVKGLRSLTELQNRQAKFQEAEAKLVAARNRLKASLADVENARIQILAIAADFREKLAKAESDLRSTETYAYDLQATIVKLRNELTNVEVRRGFYAVIAPQDGYVVRAVKTGIGEVIKEGEPLLIFMPAEYQLAAEVFVRPLDVALLQTGQKVRLQFDGWPAFVFSGWPNLSYGTFGGRIRAIDYVEAGTGNFRILIEPDPDDAPWPIPPAYRRRRTRLVPPQRRPYLVRNSGAKSMAFRLTLYPSFTRRTTTLTIKNEGAALAWGLPLGSDANPFAARTLSGYPGAASPLAGHHDPT
jgi:multidrug resistance efflux pump